MSKENKKERKKFKPSTIIIVVLLMIIFVMMFSSGGSNSSQTSTDETVTSDTSDKKEEVATVSSKTEDVKDESPVVEDVNDGVSVSDEQMETIGGDYIQIGDTTIAERYLYMTPTDAYIGSDASGKVAVFVIFDLENTSENGNATIRNTDFHLYVDDYQVQPVWTMAAEDVANASAFIVLDPGRKGTYKFVSTLPEGTDYSNKVEVSLPNGKLILVTDNSADVSYNYSDNSESGMTVYEGSYYPDNGNWGDVIEINGDTVYFYIGSSQESGKILLSELPTFIQVEVDGSTECGLEFSYDYSEFKLTSYGDYFKGYDDTYRK